MRTGHQNTTSNPLRTTLTDLRGYQTVAYSHVSAWLPEDETELVRNELLEKGRGIFKTEPNQHNTFGQDILNPRTQSIHKRDDVATNQ
jgi:hypothetical protein